MKRSAAPFFAGFALLSWCATAHTQSADHFLCDRVAADPADPDKPQDVQGVSAIAKSDVATAIKFCKSASGASRRALYQLGRAYAAIGQAAVALATYRKAAGKGSTSAMVELGVALGNDDVRAALKRIECPYVLKDKRGQVMTNLCF